MWQVRTLEHVQHVATEEIMSYVQSTPILKEAAHSKAMQEHPEWADILGTGYNDMQRRDLIYKHLAKLLAELRRITGGDATKAKQLSDLLYCRAHAGEQRRQDEVQKKVEHNRNVAVAIGESLREFVHALHEAGGKGRYPSKIRHAQQVMNRALLHPPIYTHARTHPPTKTYREVPRILSAYHNLTA